MRPLVIALALSGACFETLDERDVPCDSQGRCLVGASCLVQRCVADHSIAAGDTCSAPVQCAEGLVCTTGQFMCESPLSWDGTVDAFASALCACDPAPATCWSDVHRDMA